jgi:hypothetical protein
MSSKLPPPTPSKLKGKLLGMYERHYAWSYGDDGHPKTSRSPSNGRRRLFTLWTLFGFFCLITYLILGRLMVHLPEQRPMVEEPLVAQPEQIRRVVNTCARDLPLMTVRYASRPFSIQLMIEHPKFQIADAIPVPSLRTAAWRRLGAALLLSHPFQDYVR